jgi:uncharacterized damage-inducible protein DinB
MIQHSKLIQEFYDRDLHKLREELNAYNTEANIWKTEGNISNSAGNLTLHLIGNLNHFIGATLGNTGYVRHREEEFTQKNIARSELLKSLDATIVMVNNVLGSLSNEDLEKEFPLMKHDKRESTAHFLVHLYGHLAYHLGQVNYHRRLIDK